jgi:hypothetical protein
VNIYYNVRVRTTSGGMFEALSVLPHVDIKRSRKTHFDYDVNPYIHFVLSSLYSGQDVSFDSGINYRVPNHF